MKSVQEQWDEYIDFAMQVNDEPPTAEKILEIRRIFYSGAVCFYNLLQDMLCDETLSPRQILEQLNNYRHEFEMFEDAETNGLAAYNYRTDIKC